jgi:hypothetical protein
MVSKKDIDKAMQGASFPASKRDLLDIARRNNSPGDVMDLMQDFPDKSYLTAADVIDMAEHLEAGKRTF